MSVVRTPTRSCRAATLAGALAAIALLGAGCGGEDESDTVSTVPTIEPATPTGPTGAAGAQGESGGVEANGDGLSDGEVQPPPESGGSKPQDSPENDIPPEPGTPEAAFEQFCDENPDACG